MERGCDARIVREGRRGAGGGAAGMGADKADYQPGGAAPSPSPAEAGGRLPP